MHKQLCIITDLHAFAYKHLLIAKPIEFLVSLTSLDAGPGNFRTARLSCLSMALENKLNSNWG